MPYSNLELTCEQCGGTFAAHRRTQRFCSHACRAAAASAASARECSIDGCNASAVTRGWCDRHYSAWKRTGDPLGWRDNVQRRFWERVDKKRSGCWVWTGHVAGGDYGQIKVNGVSVMVHRYAYELLVGPIPDGLQIDHLCRNRRCVNPKHLEPVVARTNVLRSVPYWERLQPMPTCVDCGKQLSRRDAVRCKAHANAHRHRG